MNLAVPFSFLYNHPQILLGYCIAVLFPVPWLSRLLLDIHLYVGKWLASQLAKLLSYVKAKIAQIF
jgi:hypothetical protein